MSPLTLTCGKKTPCRCGFQGFKGRGEGGEEGGGGGGVVLSEPPPSSSSSGIARARIAQFTCQLRNTFRRTWRSGSPPFFCPSAHGRVGQAGASQRGALHKQTNKQTNQRRRKKRDNTKNAHKTRLVGFGSGMRTRRALFSSSAAIRAQAALLQASTPGGSSRRLDSDKSETALFLPHHHTFEMYICSFDLSAVFFLRLLTSSRWHLTRLHRILLMGESHSDFTVNEHL